MDANMTKLARQMRDHPLSENEAYRLSVIRLASHDTDPSPSLRVTQELRLLFQPSALGAEWRSGSEQMASDDRSTGDDG